MREVTLSGASYDDAPMVVVPPAELDIASEALFSEQLRLACASDAPVVVVDFAGVTFCDTSAVRALVVAKQALDAQGCALEIRHPSTGLRRVTTLLSLDAAFGLQQWPGTSADVAGGAQPDVLGAGAARLDLAAAGPARAPGTVGSTAADDLPITALRQRVRETATLSRLTRLLSMELRARGSAARDRAAGHPASEGSVPASDPPVPTRLPHDC